MISSKNVACQKALTPAKRRSPGLPQAVVVEQEKTTRGWASWNASPGKAQTFRQVIHNLY